MVMGRQGANEPFPVDLTKEARQPSQPPASSSELDEPSDATPGSRPSLASRASPDATESELTRFRIADQARRTDLAHPDLDPITFETALSVEPVVFFSSGDVLTPAMVEDMLNNWKKPDMPEKWWERVVNPPSPADTTIRRVGEEGTLVLMRFLPSNLFDVDRHLLWRGS